MAYGYEIQIVGDALNSTGFTGLDSISGLGLNTFGFLWSNADRWSECDKAESTTWTECEICTDGNG